MRISDWSSDVCSSDLKLAFFRPEEPQFGEQFARKAVNRENISHRVPLSSALVFRPRTGETFLRETALIARLRFSAVRALRSGQLPEIGRSSCRARVCHYV